MATPKQNDANRQNAQKSTGPRSPEGKAASRFNALKSGIDAQAQVIPGEHPDQLEAQRKKSSYDTNKHPIGRVLYFGDRVFDRLQRRIDSIGRNYHRALKELQSLEAAEQPVECLATGAS